MANTAKSVANLNIASTLSMSDRVVVLVNPSSTSNVKTANLSVFVANLALSNSVPANSTSNGFTGTIRYDSDYVYICVANNTWKRSSISNW